MPCAPREGHVASSGYMQRLPAAAAVAGGAAASLRNHGRLVAATVAAAAAALLLVWCATSSGLLAPTSATVGTGATVGPRIALMLVGVTAGFDDGVRAALLQHVVRAQLAAAPRSAIDLVVCDDSRNITEAAFAGWPVASAAVHAFAAAKFERQMLCYERLRAQEQLQGLRQRHSWYVVVRTDLQLYGPAPPLGTLDVGAVHARVRQAHLIDGLTTDHFSWLFHDDLCVDQCPQPCTAYSRRWMVADDQAALVPASQADAFFYAYKRLNGALSAAPCAKLGPKAVTWDEQRLTCAVLAGGGRWLPLRLPARLNPRVSHKHGEARWPIEWVQLPPLAKNCS